MPKEIWKHLIDKEYEHYEISNLGRIRKGDRILKPSMDKYGYLKLNLYKKPKNFFVHRLVLSVFKENKDNKPQVNHKNGDKTNNNIENLEWSTISENIKHAYDNNLKDTSGERHSNNKLNWSSVNYIRNSNKKKSELAKQFNVTVSTIYYVIRNKTWKQVE